MSNEFKIEAGKYYRLRSGERVYVALTNKPGINPIVGWKDGGTLVHWMIGGSQYGFGAESLLDIISEWVEPERIPWEHLPKWCRWWAKDENGGESGYFEKPRKGAYFWSISAGHSGLVTLPPEFRSNYTGDWRNSLRERPEGV